jgi:hypothetical protein
MRRNGLLAFPLILLCLSVYSQAQQWSGILKPTYGSGACTYGTVASAGQCAIDWTQVGIPGGIQSSTWTQSGSTISASACGGSDCTPTIQAALNSCGTNHYVLLGSGTFLINGQIQIPSNCVLRGSGPQNTILSAHGTSGAVVAMGAVNDAPYSKGSAIINSGAAAGSTSMVINGSAISGYPTSIAAGGYMIITELNDPVYVTTDTIQNATCTYCDTSMFGGTRVRGQILEVTSVSGTNPITVAFNPPLYTNYGTASGTGPGYATPFGAANGGAPDVKDAGLENLQIYANGTGVGNGMSSIVITECAYCWVQGIESNYTDADHVDLEFCFRCEIRDSYFSNAYTHGAGGSDADLMLAGKTSGTLIENNILERLHSSIVTNFGAAGNVVAYNYSMGSFDTNGYNTNMIDFAFHGAHPQFNLFEGNVGPDFQPDSWHGSTAFNSTFRNWWTGITLVAPFTAAGCSNPWTAQACYQGRHPVDWADAHWTYQQSRPMPIAFPNTSTNIIGDALGSDAASTMAAGNLYNGGAAHCTSCTLPATQRNYSTRDTPPVSAFYSYTFGYDTGDDTTGAGVTTFAGGPSNVPGYWVGLAYKTAFIHGAYDAASSSVLWSVHGSGSQTLPASFYKSSKPSWFGNVPWPPIGPDVTGGPDSATGGHANPIPAEVCYMSTAKDSNGMLVFDPISCYGNTSGSPAPPTNLNAIVQ